MSKLPVTPFALGAQQAVSPAAAKANIPVILTDDLGYGNVHCCKPEVTPTMKTIRRIATILAMVIAISSNAQIGPEPLAIPGVDAPTEVQKQMNDRGYGMFICFAPNTYVNKEWSHGEIPMTVFNPAELDCDQWIRVAKEAGFRHVLLLTKHHDGFCLWPSRYTEFSVKNAPVKTDIVAEVAKACKKYDVKLGLYYSLWDCTEPTHKLKDPKPYVEFMKNQLTELLTHYGPVCEFWFDGGWAKKPQDWDIPGIYAHIKKLQPNCLVTINHSIGPIANPAAIGQAEEHEWGGPTRYWPLDFRTKDPDLVRYGDPKTFHTPDGLRYLPFEHTICISDEWNWFQKDGIIPVRSVDELEFMFYHCTSQGNGMLLNVAPGTNGKILPHEEARVLELADRLGIRGGKTPLPGPVRNRFVGARITASKFIPGREPAKAMDDKLSTSWTPNATSGTLSFELVYPVAIDRITIIEQARHRKKGTDGFSTLHDYFVQSFRLEGVDAAGKTVELARGDSIGAARIIHLPAPVTVKALRLIVDKASRPFGISHVEAGLSTDRISRI